VCFGQYYGIASKKLPSDMSVTYSIRLSVKQFPNLWHAHSAGSRFPGVSQRLQCVRVDLWKECLCVCANGNCSLLSADFSVET
jgi:hypothetical protein